MIPVAEDQITKTQDSADVVAADDTVDERQRPTSFHH